MLKRPSLILARRADKGCIELRVIHARKLRRFGLGITCTAEQWSDDARCFTARMPGHVAKNRTLQHVLERAHALVDSLMAEQTFTLQAFADAFRHGEAQDLIGFLQEVIERLQAEGHAGNAHVHHSLLIALRRYTQGQPLPFRAVTPRWLEDWEHHMRVRGVSPGGASNYLRTLRAVINRAVRAGLMPERDYPFRNKLHPNGYPLGRLKSTYRPRAITNGELAQLQAWKWGQPGREKTDQYLRMWLLLFRLRGMNFADLAHLKWDDIRDGRIYYTRRKTMRSGRGAHITVSITPETAELLSHFPRTGNAYVVGVLDSRQTRTPKQELDRVASVRKWFNAEVRAAAREMGITANITSYTARHSFATFLLRKGVPVNKIGDALGHADYTTTMHYTERLVGDQLDEIDRML
jgi:integrase/recombinase XerD